MAQGHGDRANPSSRAGTHLGCHSPGQGDLAGCCSGTWSCLWGTQNQLEDEKMQQKEAPALLKLKQSPFRRISHGLGSCQSHLVALNQQVWVKGALLGVSPHCPDHPGSPNGIPKFPHFRHSPASRSASQRSQAGDVWLTTAPACG